jgi:hypothetical protein
MDIKKFIWVALYLGSAILHTMTNIDSFIESIFVVLPAFLVGLAVAVVIYFAKMKEKWEWYHVLNTATGIMLTWVIIVNL